MTEPIYSITTEAERDCLARLAREVKPHGTILEVGTLYGGVTEVLAKNAPAAEVVTIDNFSWHPETLPANTAASVMASLHSVGVKNFRIIEDDSREVGKRWNDPIDLLWIDGGHSYEFVYSDLYNFGRHAEVIALHDYNNPIWLSVRKAIEAFIAKDRIWQIAEVVDMVCVLRKL